MNMIKQYLNLKNLWRFIDKFDANHGGYIIISSLEKHIIRLDSIRKRKNFIRKLMQDFPTIP